MTSFDIVGDIHGQHDKLIALLGKLGYSNTGGAWRHASRRVIFIGDFIDRGPRQFDTLDIVRRMTDCGSALALLGNHEFHALAYYTEDPAHPGSFLRPHTLTNHCGHQGFLAEMAWRPAEYKPLMDWFYSLPLWIEMHGIRLVHACWHDRHMRSIQAQLAPGNCLTPSLLVSASRDGSPDFRAVEAILRGVEAALPGGRTFQDGDGQVRDAVQIRWWDPEANTFRKAGIVPQEHAHVLTDDFLPPGTHSGCPADKPIVFGHYWMSGPPAVLSAHAACVDYSAGRTGPLVAYRWDGEPTLQSSQFIATHA